MHALDGFYGINFREFALFQNVDDVVIEQVLSAGQIVDFQAGTPLVFHHDQGNTFFVTLAGLAKLMLVHDHQEPMNLTLFRTGDFFGELAILEPTATRSANVVAVTDVSMLVIPQNAFMHLVRNYPELMINIARVMGQRLMVMNERLMVERWRDHTRKVAHTLVFFANKGKWYHEAGTILLPSLPLKEWALFCYTMREEFMDSLEKLKLAGAIRWQNQRIAITNLDVLRRYADLHLVQ